MKVLEVLEGFSPKNRSKPCSAARLSRGAYWVCRPGGEHPHSQPSWAETAAARVEAAAAVVGLTAVSAAEIRRSLLDPWEPAEGDACTKVQVINPEAMPELDYCKWDGDGHYDMSRYTPCDPPTLGQAILYARAVDAAAAKAELTVHVSTEAFRSQGAVLAGAYLVLAQGFSAKDAWDELLVACPKPSADASKAWDRFPSPFSVAHVTGTMSLSVLDCLSGLEAARDRGWLEDYRTFDVEGWRLLRRKFDASWIIPREVMAMGDPAFTSENPRFPELRAALRHKCGEAEPEPEGSPTGLKPVDVQDRNNGSTSTVTPATRTPSGRAGPDHEVDLLRTDTFNRYFERMNITDLFRLNWRHEGGGNKKQSPIDDMAITRISHCFEDGDVPAPEVLRQFLEDCDRQREQTGRSGCIAVHCKAGLGRTIVMVGAYAARRHYMDGSAFHGWARMCRPGSVQYPKQETFVKDLKPVGKTVALAQVEALRTENAQLMIENERLRNRLKLVDVSPSAAGIATPCSTTHATDGVETIDEYTTKGMQTIDGLKSEGMETIDELKPVDVSSAETPGQMVKSGDDSPRPMDDERSARGQPPRQAPVRLSKAALSGPLSPAMPATPEVSRALVMPTGPLSPATPATPEVSRALVMPTAPLSPTTPAMLEASRALVMPTSALTYPPVATDGAAEASRSISRERPSMPSAAERNAPPFIPKLALHGVGGEPPPPKAGLTFLECHTTQMSQLLACCARPAPVHVELVDADHGVAKVSDDKPVGLPKIPTRATGLAPKGLAPKGTIPKAPMSARLLQPGA